MLEKACSSQQFRPVATFCEPRVDFMQGGECGSPSLALFVRKTAYHARRCTQLPRKRLLLASDCQRSVESLNCVVETVGSVFL